MLQGFKTFLFRGNVVDLAVAVVIGGAFGAVVTSFVTHIVTPLIAAAVGQPDFSAIQVVVNGTPVLVGNFLNALLAFVLVTAAVYFFIVSPMNAWNERRKRGGPPADPTSKKCPECVSEIPVAAKRCAFCAQPVA